jgi:hypothetical protein
MARESGPLFMLGNQVYSQNRVNECNRDVTTAILLSHHQLHGLH